MPEPLGYPPLGGTVLGGDQEYFENFLKYYIDTIPPPFRLPRWREFLERFLWYPALDLANINALLDDLVNYINPATAPEEWIDWIIHEWFGFHLIPDGYPLERKRRLLANLHLHFKRRHTPLGLTGLLSEFGIFNEVYDRPLYWGGYYGSFGSEWPLHVRVRVLDYEPFELPRNSYYGSYWGHQYYHSAKQIITEDFVVALCNWSRAAGVEMLIEFVTASFSLLLTDTIPDDDEVVIP
jgi:hypothetical protein